MTKLVLGKSIKPTFEPDVKKFYLEGISVEGTCPECGEVVVRKEPYLSYPVMNDENMFSFQHWTEDDVSHEWKQDISFELTLTLGQAYDLDVWKSEDE